MDKKIVVYWQRFLTKWFQSKLKIATSTCINLHANTPLPRVRKTIESSRDCGNIRDFPSLLCIN